MRTFRIALLTVLLSGLFLGADTDPVIGRWKLNWEKSQSEGAAPKSVVRTYAKFRDGFRVSEVWRGAGRTTKFVYAAKYDGHEYPISQEGGGTITFTRNDANLAEGVAKTKENGTYTFKRTVSQDGKTLTIETMQTDSSGTGRRNVLVYDKMK
ncbi:MAG TPA: hypothetical protein VKB88_31155 [Bryobacteraceae bacterium]|nr:hypothetical protein [Bryobacteraceae bacterium]